MECKGIIAVDNMLVDHIRQIRQWSERGWPVEVVHSEHATDGASPNVLPTLAKVHAGLPLRAVGLIGEDNSGDYITAMLDQYHINRQLVQHTSSAPTPMTQVMTNTDGQRTFFHSPSANRLFDLPAFEPLGTPLKIFHLGYLLLLESLDRPDGALGTRSARLLAQIRDRGYELSLDLVSCRGDPHYRPRVLPVLAHLGCLAINELRASEFSGLGIRLPNDEPHVADVARAASALLDVGVRQRVVIHCPEGTWGVSRTEAGRWVPSWRLPPEEIIGSVGTGNAFCAGLLYDSHERWPLTDSLQLAHACARTNLQAAGTIDGTKMLPELQAFVQLQNGQTGQIPLSG